MSKIIYLYSRNHDLNEVNRRKLLEICKQLTPDNIKSEAYHEICTDGQSAFGITMHNYDYHKIGNSILFGHLFEQEDANWHLPNSEFPDGNYVIFRNSKEYLEIVSDAAATRTVWYYFDDDYFLASTSQRAIIMFLGSFDFNERVVPWMLSTGTLGPEFSWDRRIQRLQPASAITLDKKKWMITKSSEEICFSPVKKSRNKLADHIDKNIRASVKKMNSLNLENWLLPLSGGYDSRALLCYLKEEITSYKKLKAVTWGMEKSFEEEGNDAKIAKDLANSIGIRHDSLYTDVSEEPIEKIVDRFILCGEGRIDHIAAYMDGMEIWRKFYEEGVKGVIRGDEGFGWSDVSSELTARLNTGCALCTDFRNLKKLYNLQDLPRQELPDFLQKDENETVEQWRDRLYHSYRLPTVLSALSDIKFSYVDQLTPLLSARILKAVRSLPDSCRTNKVLFKKIVESLAPDIPIATKSANASPGEILKTKEMVQLMSDEFNSETVRSLFTEGFIEYVKNGMAKQDPTKDSEKKAGLVGKLKSFIPQKIRFWFQDMGVGPVLDGNKLAFRIFIIIRMHNILNKEKDLLH
ncbi:MAG: asparagine synthase-related protein [Balneolaceae bacterium]|nr:asparagine synthase-related protein [Balneolaceae bacterium]MDR9409548.1 asparagine synthase-related protein [Balneolaceae bacterium]